jgi:acyl carrier protein
MTEEGVKTDDVDLLATITRIVRTNLNDLTLEIDMETRPDAIAAWNSIKMVDIILDIEDWFGIRFDIEDIDKLRKVGDMIDTVRLRLPH